MAPRESNPLIPRGVTEGERGFWPITDRNPGNAEFQRYQQLIESLPIGYARTTLDGEFLAANSKFVDMVGGDSREDVLSRDVEAFYQDPTTRQRVVSALAENGEVHDEELKVTTLAGETIWVLVTAHTVEDEEDRCFDAFVQDITDRRRRENTLREMHSIISSRDQTFEEQVQALLDLGRAELDIHYGTLSQIRGDEYTFEIVSSEDDSIESSDVVPVSATNCELVVKNEQTLVMGDIERDAPKETHRDGFTEMGISCYIGAPVSDGEGIYGTFCFYDREARSGQFSTWEVTLVDLMSRWVSSELEKQRANSKLQDKNEQLEQFASIVSHDLRNPLNVAQGRLELVADECASDHIDHVFKAHQRMETLIEDLLDLALKGEQVGETEPIDPSVFSEYWWRNIDTKEATLRVDINRQIRADPGRLQQLFENLVRNAIEHAGRDVTVTMGELQNGFYLEDDGPGIPEEERDRILTKGYSTSHQRTGLGLRIVRQVVESHGWDLLIIEGSDGGARFEISDVEFAAG